MKEIINGCEVYYEMFGYGKKVVFFHGFCVDSRLMTGCMEPIFSARNFCRIYIDLPGMGQSKQHDGIKNADEMTALLAALIKKLLGNEEFFVAGESYGGYLSMGLVEHFGNQIGGIALVAPCVIANYKRRTLPEHGIVFEDEALAAGQKNNPDFMAFRERAVIVTAETWERYKSDILPGIKAADMSFIAEYLEHGYGFSDENRVFQQTFSGALCVIVGKQDSVVGYLDAQKRFENYPRAELIIIDGAGHNLQIEKPVEFEKSMGSWLNSIGDI